MYEMTGPFDHRTRLVYHYTLRCSLTYFHLMSINNI